MRKYLIMATLIIGLISITGCNAVSKSFGGTISVELEKGKKLVNCTWKDSEFWYLTRDMKSNEEPETYEFIEKSNLGVLEGKVIIKEKSK